MREKAPSATTPLKSALQVVLKVQLCIRKREWDKSHCIHTNFFETILCNLVGHHFEMISEKEGTHPVFWEKVKEALSRCCKSSFLQIALPVNLRFPFIFSKTNNTWILISKRPKRLFKQLNMLPT